MLPPPESVAFRPVLCPQCQHEVDPMERSSEFPKAHCTRCGFDFLVKSARSRSWNLFT